jgi:hypothetical protein
VRLAHEYTRGQFSQLLQIWDWRAVASDMEAHPGMKCDPKNPVRIAGKPSFQIG